MHTHCANLGVNLCLLSPAKLLYSISSLLAIIYIHRTSSIAYATRVYVHASRVSLLAYHMYIQYLCIRAWYNAIQCDRMRVYNCAFYDEPRRGNFNVESRIRDKRCLWLFQWILSIPKKCNYRWPSGVINWYVIVERLKEMNRRYALLQIFFNPREIPILNKIFRRIRRNVIQIRNQRFREK